jgi:hypothetical protein
MREAATLQVWKGVKELGCGVLASQRLYVCRYKAGNTLSSDTPNMMGAYTANVRPLPPGLGAYPAKSNLRRDSARSSTHTVGTGAPTV